MGGGVAEQSAGGEGGIPFSSVCGKGTSINDRSHRTIVECILDRSEDDNRVTLRRFAIGSFHYYIELNE